MARRMSARRAREIIDAAELVKAPDWADTHRWHVISGSEVLVVISPARRGTSRSSWRWSLPSQALNPQPQPTRQQAAAHGIAAWMRWATSKK